MPNDNLARRPKLESLLKINEALSLVFRDKNGSDAHLFTKCGHMKLQTVNKFRQINKSLTESEVNC